MSFSGEVKNELVRQISASRHCQIAELSALLGFCGTVQSDEEDDFSLIFSTEHREVAEKYLQLLKRAFRIEPDMLLMEGRLMEKREYLQITMDDPDLCVKVLQAVRFLDKNKNFAEDVPLSRQTILQKNCCRRAYVRGAFLAAGSISDPNRSYHFEIVCDSENHAEELRELLETMHIRAHTAPRKKYFIVYVKDSAQISDLLGLMDASVSLLEFENVRIVREVRGNVNRKVNCETANINKTANAAARQIEDIEYIERTIGLGSLPNGLDEVAEVRLQYPMATLAELGSLLNKPLGKSGVNHRLRKLSQIAEALREEQGGSI